MRTRFWTKGVRLRNLRTWFAYQWAFHMVAPLTSLMKGKIFMHTYGLTGYIEGNHLVYSVWITPYKLTPPERQASTKVLQPSLITSINRSIWSTSGPAIFAKGVVKVA